MASSAKANFHLSSLHKQFVCLFVFVVCHFILFILIDSDLPLNMYLSLIA